MLMELQERLRLELDRLTSELGGEIARTSSPSGSSRASGAGEDRPLRNRVRQLERLIASIPEADPATIRAEGAGFGSTVVLLDLRTGEELVYTIMSGDDVDPDLGDISLASPIGHALVGRRVGDEIEVETPRGSRSFRVLAVTTLPRLLDGTGGAPLPIQ